MDKSTKMILSKFNCVYHVFEKGTKPEVIEKAYHKALKKGKKEGRCPALLLANKYVEEWLYGIQDESEFDKEALIVNCGDDGKSILKNRFDEDLEEKEVIEKFIGNAGERQIHNSFRGYMNFGAEETQEDVILLKLPVKNPWEVIAWLPMGGWNDCPKPEEIIAIAKYWYEKYGAIPAVFTHDEMEFYVEKLVKEKDALELAKEHYAFCPDRVDQCTESGTLSEIAVGLPKSHVWYFWWD